MSQNIDKMSHEVFEKFLDLSSQLSPENLCCDGEASQSYVRQKLRRINKEWKELEKQVGHRVTEDEVWKRHIDNMR